MRLNAFVVVLLVALPTVIWVGCKTRGGDSALRADGDLTPSAYAEQCGSDTQLASAASPGGQNTGLALADGDAALAAKVKAILTTKHTGEGLEPRACSDCHSPSSEEGTGSMPDIMDRNKMVSSGKIKLETPDQSRLYKKIKSGSMPPDGYNPLTADEIATVLAWITAGAPDFNGGGDVTPPPGPGNYGIVSERDKIQCIAKDLTKVGAADRQFTRYFTLTHYTNAGMPAGEVQKYREALSKLLNSLSMAPDIAKPLPIDPSQTIFRIDLRNYQWSKQIWDRIADAHPYRFDVSDVTTSASIAQTTGAEQAFLRADWFAATATVPPLYHEIMNIPLTDRELEQRLNVNVEKNIQERQAARAGFLDSGVSNNNRMLERHPASFGAYWKSYDFAGKIGERNLFANPLGPCSSDGAVLDQYDYFRPCATQAIAFAAPAATPGAGLPPLGSGVAQGQNLHFFKHDGGEIIFNLPNGLQGYMLTTATGARLDKGPLEVVSDPKRFDKAVVNGLSCMGCHIKGMITKEDQVRPVVEANPNAFTEYEREFILGLYKKADKFALLLTKDEKKFTDALAEAGVTVTPQDPIFAQAAKFEDVVNLKAAAGELGVTVEKFKEALAANATLAQNLGALNVPGGTVAREVLESQLDGLVSQLFGGGGGPGGSLSGFDVTGKSYSCQPSEYACAEAAVYNPGAEAIMSYFAGSCEQAGGQIKFCTDCQKLCTKNVGNQTAEGGLTEVKGFNSDGQAATCKRLNPPCSGFAGGFISGGMQDFYQACQSPNGGVLMPCQECIATPLCSKNNGNFTGPIGPQGFPPGMLGFPSSTP